MLLVAALALPTFSCLDDGAPRPRPPAGQDEARQKQVKNQFSSWDGSHKGLTRYIKASLARPDTYEHIKTAYDDRLVHLVITTRYQYRDEADRRISATIKVIVDLDGNVKEVVSQAR